MAAIKGLYAVTPDMADTAVLAGKVRSALEGGARLVQYRSKAAARPLRLEQARVLAVLCREFSAPLIVNDDVDFAIEIDADGVHLGAEDGSLRAARSRLAPGKILGASCYNRIEDAVAAQAAGATYCAFGSFFASAVKPGAVRAPLELLRAAHARLDVPVVAIGGITVANAGEVIAAGADAIAVISALFDAPDVKARACEFAQRFT